MKRVLLTGATGIIGKEAIKPLLDSGFEIFAVSSKNQPSIPEVTWVKADLLDFSSIKDVFSKIKPQYLLHFAWDTTPGSYLESNFNFDWVVSSLEMLKQFKQNGGKRVVYAGTCFEYEFKDEPLKETDKFNPESTYAKCKKNLCELASLYCEKNDLSFGWGRIFYVYGHGEQEKRLTPHLINSFKADKEVVITCGSLLKDYMYTKDIAGAFVKFLDTEVKGCVNICTGEAVSIKDYAKLIASKLNKEDLLILKDEPCNQPPVIVGDNSRLRNEVGYNIKYSHDSAIDEIIGAKTNESGN